MPKERQAGPAAKQLAALRERAGFTLRGIAAELGIPSTTYGSWETESKGDYMRFDRVQMLAKVLVGRGDPKITEAEVLALAGMQRGLAAGDGTPKARRGEGETPDEPSAPNQTRVPEIDVIAGAGIGGDAIAEAFTDDQGNNVSRDMVRAEWGIPSAYAANVLGIRPDRARILEVRGDSMSPTLESGDRAMIDTGDRVPAPDGLFALHNGIGVVVKRLEFIPNSDPPGFKIMSDNPKHSTYERTIEEINVIGRVVWFARKI
jgi:phage repressor protein C with HTH and peptisase S24 domain/DNA-binding XRE family transcriptional regulator